MTESTAFTDEVKMAAAEADRTHVCSPALVDTWKREIAAMKAARSMIDRRLYPCQDGKTVSVLLPGTEPDILLPLAQRSLAQCLAWNAAQAGGTGARR